MKDEQNKPPQIILRPGRDWCDRMHEVLLNHPKGTIEREVFDRVLAAMWGNPKRG